MSDKKIIPCENGRIISRFADSISEIRWDSIFYQDSNGNKVHIGNTMFKPCCNKGGDRKNDRENFIGRSKGTETKPGFALNAEIFSSNLSMFWLRTS